MDTLTWLLITAREGGVTVQPDGDRLTMKGPKNHRTVAHLRQHKAAIKEFYAGLDERLRRGQQWLVRAHKELWDKEGWPVGTPSMVEATKTSTPGTRSTVWSSHATAPSVAAILAARRCAGAAKATDEHGELNPPFQISSLNSAPGVLALGNYTRPINI